MKTELDPDTVLPWKRKREIRVLAETRRRQSEGKEGLSRRICGRLARLSEYIGAATILIYASRSFEVHTREFLGKAWDDGKCVVLPCCESGDLKLYRIKSMSELVTRTLGVLEPGETVRHREQRKGQIDELDLIVVPGVAFDRRGGRLGHGKGYYDGLLAHARPETHIIGLAFDCQVFPDVPMMEHDVFMHKVVTESTVYARVKA